MGKVPRPNIVWRGAHPNNYMVGREGHGPDGRNTYHHVVGSAESAVLVFNNGSRGASSNLVITNLPDIAAFMCVDLANTSFCDTNWDSNVNSITMEHHGDWRNGYRDPQVIENSAKVVAWLRDQGLVNRYQRHRDVARTGTVCPADLPVEEIWNRATEIINHYNNVDNRPQWLKDRVGESGTVYAHKDSIFLYNLETLQPYDARRWGINQSFEIGSAVQIGGHRYYITKSSTDNNTPAGLRDDEISRSMWTPPLQWTPMNPPRKLIANGDIRVLNLDTRERVGDVIPAGKEIEFETQAQFEGATFLRSKYATSKGLNWGIELTSLREIVATPPPVVVEPQPTSPEWVDAIVDEPNREMYVLRATPLIDLENGRTYIDPKTNKEVWFQAGDIIKEMSAHVVIAEVTYRLTEFAFAQTKAGNWEKFANGIRSNDLTTDPKACPAGTPANPNPAPEPEDPVEEMPDVPTNPTVPPTAPSSGSNYMEELLKQNNSLLQKIVDLITGLIAKLTGNK